ncbi:MAG: hypothetical protein P1U87_08575 [Verrucomicrobiales bacterium]|nr:hypothetical protein [Verrucomicrobiales bacterium]
MNFNTLMIRGLCCAMLLLTSTSWSVPKGNDKDSIFQWANENFEQGDFEKASSSYRSLIDSGHISPDLFYNLGTSLYREGKAGEAMLWLRRAQLLDGNLPEAKQNTEFLRTRIAFLEFADDGFQLFLRGIPPGVFLWGGSLLVWLGLVSIALSFSLQRFRDNQTWWIALGIAFLMLSFVMHRLGQFRDSRVAPENFATVIVTDAVASTAPTPGSSTVIELPPGSEVRVLQVNGPWTYVDIPGNLRGWVRSESVEANWPLPEKTTPRNLDIPTEPVEIAE